MAAGSDEGRRERRTKGAAAATNTAGDNGIWLPLEVVGLAISFFSDTIVTNSRRFSISLLRCFALTCFTLSSLRQYLINEISRQR